MKKQSRVLPYYYNVTAVGRQATTVTKRNFSDLKKMDDLVEVCSKHVSISVTSIKSSQETVKGFLIEVCPDVDKLKSRWAALFETSSQLICLTEAPALNELQAHIQQNPGTGLYYNGAVKMLLHYIMRLGSEEDVRCPSSSYYCRISTTTDPTSDKCGLPVKIGTGKKEDALNGEHALHAYFMICKQGVDCTTRHQDLGIYGI